MGKGNHVLEILDINKLNCEESNSDKYILDKEFKGLLPLNNVEIMFEDDVWDLQVKLLKGKPIFIFSDINFNYKDYIKLYVLEGIVNSNAISTLKKNYNVLKYICRHLDENNVYLPEGITRDVAIKFNDNVLKKYTSEGERIRARRLFILLLEKIESKTGTDYKFLKEYLEKRNNHKLRKAQIESGKTPAIEKEVFNRIIRTALKEISDGRLTKEEIMQACIVLILSQTGIRISDVSTLEAKMDSEINIIDGDESVRHLKYYSHKILKAYTETYMTEICFDAYKKLEQLTQEDRETRKTKYLFSNRDGEAYTPKTIENYIKRFVIRNCKEIGVLNKKYKGNYVFTHEVNKKEKLIQEEKYEFLNEGYYISIPKAHQYRVSVCNELINKGVELKWVQKHMGHLTSEMTIHYVRAKEEENAKVIEGIVKKDFKLIGKEAERLIHKIDEFIQKGNYNIETDLDKIIRDISNKVPIRAKKNGYCIKSSFGRKCKYNEFMCAFDVCPNHCTSYLFADVSYKRYKEWIEIIEYNRTNGFISESVMETNKLRRFIDDYFIKELLELENEISKIGYDKIISNNKNLEYLCSNIDSVIDEVKTWREEN